jgi:hypothetical protein
MKMSGRMGDALRLTGWAALAFGALSLASVPGEDDGSLCGVWGCYPPPRALVAMHAFWGVVATAGTDWLLRHLRTPMLGIAGKIASFTGLALLTALILHGTIPWLNFTGWPMQYIGRRVLYVVATATDAPFIQLTVAGVVCWSVARRRESRPANVPVGTLVAEVDNLKASGLPELTSNHLEEERGIRL